MPAEILNERVSVESLRGRVESFILEALESHQDVQVFHALPQLSFNRFDIAFKLFYLEGIGLSNCPIHEEVYKAHIAAFSLGSYTEPGNDEKNTFKAYVDSFASTYEDISRNGFDDARTLIPVSNDGSLLNGAHRATSCLFLKKNAVFLKTDLPPHNYDYAFFRNRGVSDVFIDIAARTFIKYASDVYVLLLWPSAYSKVCDVDPLLPNVVYKKSICLTPQGAHNLIAEVYAGETWLGAREHGFSGASGKLVHCFVNAKPLMAYVIQGKSLADVLELKEKIRQVCGIGKHSVHITDVKAEAVNIANFLFSEAGTHYLNNAKPCSRDFLEKLERFQMFVSENSILSERVALDSGMVLASYGLRDAKDIDYVSMIDLEARRVDGISSHDKDMEFHGLDRETLIFDPRYHFWLMGSKFVSLRQLHTMKRNRAAPKDVIDLQLMAPALRASSGAWELVENMHYGFLFYRAKFSLKAKKLLRIVGLFDVAKSIYHKFKAM